jgi:tRNA 2-thiouridine synthesizing protein E
MDMPKKTMIEYDDEGFLVDPVSWNEAIAEQLARQYDIFELNEQQWSIILELRYYYFVHGAVPPLSRICRFNDMDHYCIDTFFRNRGIAAWRIAGLPYPGEEAIAYM